MFAMFWCIFNQFIGNWNTQNVSTMSRMFEMLLVSTKTLVFEHIIRNHNGSMFNGASKFNQAIGFWDTSSLINIRDMFLGASEFNQPLGGWDTASVKNMGVFKYANSFDQDLRIGISLTFNLLRWLLRHCPLQAKKGSSTNPSP